MSTIDESTRKKYNIFLPLLLITIGLIILISNLGNGKLDVWGVILRIWPLIFVYGGLEGFVRRSSVGVNSFWLLFGLALLLSNFGRISWSAWEIVFTFWPVLIISIGIDLLFNKKNSWQQMIAGLLVVSIMGILSLLFDTGKITPKIDVIKIEQMRDGANEGTITLRPSLSFLKIFSQGSSENLIEGSVRLWSGEETQTTYEVKQNKGIFELKSSGMIFLYEPGVKNRSDWNIGVSSRVPLDLTIDQIVGEQNLDLMGLEIADFATNLIVGKTNIFLPSDGSFHGEIKLVIGEIVIEVPAGVALRLEGKPLIGGIRIPDTYQQHSGYVESAQFEQNEYQVFLDLEQTIGQVIIHQK